jgi:hypothetical protein
MPINIHRHLNGVVSKEDVIKSYKASDPDNPVIFQRGEIADAELAVPGWRMAVDDLFGYG